MATKPKKPAPAGPADRGLRVISKIDGFRRAGRAWPGSAVVVPLDQLTPEQAQALQYEPNLVVDEVAVEAEAATNTTAA